MTKEIKLLTVLFFLTTMASSVYSQNKVIYIPKYIDPVLDTLEKESDQIIQVQDSITTEIRMRQKAQEEKEKAEKTVLKSDLFGVKKPTAIKDFNPVFHFPPVAQYLSGMCWSFSATSYLESEVYRLSKQRIKLSELHTVYYEYIEKARRYIQERGKSEFGEGSEGNAVFRIMKKYGAVPAEAYTGLINGDKHNHKLLFKELEDYLHFCNDNNYWDEETAIATVKIILNKYLGVPPSQFSYQGKVYSPQEFLANVLKLNFDDYVDLISTSSMPFYERGEFKVADNWWHDKSYYNVPLNEWYAVIKYAINKGMSVVIGADVSEPGYIGKEDVAFVPDFDIPYKYINQDSRELRIDNKTTVDDHGDHLIGITKVDNFDWFLIKDSGRSSRYGQFEGYYFWREDYVKLKMLSFAVHKDAVKAVISQFK